MTSFAARLPEEAESENIVIKEPELHRKERELKESPFFYERLSWKIYRYVTSRGWFEGTVWDIMLQRYSTRNQRSKQGVRQAGRQAGRE